jgi:beta-N-acetylhexosaminidase
MRAPQEIDPALAQLADAVLIPPFPGHEAPPWILAALGDGLAGVTLFGLNVGSPAQLAGLTATLRAAGLEAAGLAAAGLAAAGAGGVVGGPAAVLPVIAIDEEGGDVTRIAHQGGSPYPGNAALGAIDDVGLTEAVYAALGTDLAALGVTVDLAPAVDVNTAADNPVIGTRSFGADTALVARHGAAAVTGLQSAGVAACAKHFPGHGSTQLDSHHELATVDASAGLLAERDLPPFAAAIAAGVRAIMPGHLRVPELTGDLPASLSPAALTGLLRGELGFTGVIVSDGLEMRAVSDVYGIPEAAVLAVLAGTDLLCLGRDQDWQMYADVRAALVTAVASGRLPGARLEEAAARVAALRSWTTAVQGRGGPVGSAAAEIGLVAARRAVRVDGVPQPLHRPFVVEIVPPANMAAGAVPWGLGAWVPEGSLRRVSTGESPASPAAPIAGLLAEAAGRSLVIVVRDAHRHPAAAEVASQILAARPDAVVVEMGLPVWRPRAGLYLATFGASRISSRAAAEVLGLAVP